MTHTYQVTGMTCSGCEQKVKSSLLMHPEITNVEVSKDENLATISMAHHVDLQDLQHALGGDSSKYQLKPISHSETLEKTKSFLETYKPIFVIFSYVTSVALLSSWREGEVVWMVFMQLFMAGFFLSFSFFKLINLKAFTESYAMYDVIAKRFYPWGYIYAFIELGLGLAYATDFNPQLTNWITLAVMSVSTLGVLESILNKKKIQCACLGAVFDLPMSTITLIEDFLMIAMSAIMLISM